MQWHCKLLACLLSSGSIKHHTKSLFRPFLQGTVQYWNTKSIKVIQNNHPSTNPGCKGSETFPLAYPPTLGPATKDNLFPAALLQLCSFSPLQQSPGPFQLSPIIPSPKPKHLLLKGSLSLNRPSKVQITLLQTSAHVQQHQKHRYEWTGLG